MFSSKCFSTGITSLKYLSLIKTLGNTTLDTVCFGMTISRPLLSSILMFFSEDILNLNASVDVIAYYRTQDHAKITHSKHRIGVSHKIRYVTYDYKVSCPDSARISQVLSFQVSH